VHRVNEKQLYQIKMFDPGFRLGFLRRYVRRDNIIPSGVRTSWLILCGSEFGLPKLSCIAGQVLRVVCFFPCGAEVKLVRRFFLTVTLM
jgi:hypothetical protein